MEDFLSELRQQFPNVGDDDFWESLESAIDDFLADHNVEDAYDEGYEACLREHDIDDDDEYSEDDFEEELGEDDEDF